MRCASLARRLPSRRCARRTCLRPQRCSRQVGLPPARAAHTQRAPVHWPRARAHRHCAHSRARALARCVLASVVWRITLRPQLQGARRCATARRRRARCTARCTARSPAVRSRGRRRRASRATSSRSTRTTRTTCSAGGTATSSSRSGRQCGGAMERRVAQRASGALCMHMPHGMRPLRDI